jgi:hypothetical protein
MCVLGQEEEKESVGQEDERGSGAKARARS